MILGKKHTGFTLFELLISMTIFFIVISMVMQFYAYLVSLKSSIEGRQMLVENSYYMLERMQVQMKNYTIDYEEYFNRSAIGCDSTTVSNIDTFTRNVGANGYCDKFTAFGNQNTFITPVSEHALYHCSSLVSQSTPHKIYQNTSLSNGKGCGALGKQSFGQYALQFQDVGLDADTITGAYGDDDDTDLGLGPAAIYNHTGTQELYLISQNKEQRLLIRRALIASGDYNNQSGVDLDTEKLYTLQILKLQAFDVSNDHQVNSANKAGLYDGQTDTWACDAQKGFLCHGIPIGIPYDKYKLPNDVNDGWIKLFSNNITLSSRNLAISPTKNPDYARNENEAQINPSMQISRQAKLYGPSRAKKLPNVEAYTFSIQTTFDINTFY